VSDTTTIEIDFEVYKLIEAERRGFDEPRLAALKRLLGLNDAVPAPQKQMPPHGRAWEGDGVALPHGTLLKMTYNRTTHEGEIVDGQWLVGGSLYDTPSGAAIGVARTKSGRTTHLNGWNYWYAKLPGSNEWTLAKLLGKRH
jgi:hypothetical protein